MVALARELDLVGPQVELVLAIADEIHKQTGRRIPVNVDGAMAGVLMDLGFAVTGALAQSCPVKPLRRSAGPFRA